MFIVGGTFDNNGGKPSFFVNEMMHILGIPGINGGELSTLGMSFSFTDTLIWMPNIDNSEDKILPTIKADNPHMLLVQSKRVHDGNYTPADVVGRLLKSRALLGIVIERVFGRYEFQLMDPLGNRHCKTNDVVVLCAALKSRIQEIKRMSRVPSTRTGPVKEFTIDDKFVSVIKDFGNRFSTFINAINPNRLLGNASTRCESGFPAINDRGRMFVSRRNVDKKTLQSSDFVEIELGNGRIFYHGDNKPSVDSPVQAKLFHCFPNIRYMIHGHVYIEDAPTTEHKIPCGFLEEVGDILDVITDPMVSQFSVNLLGHGCLIACRDLDYFDTIKLTGRPFPEET